MVFASRSDRMILAVALRPR